MGESRGSGERHYSVYAHNVLNISLTPRRLKAPRSFCESHKSTDAGAKVKACVHLWCKLAEQGWVKWCVGVTGTCRSSYDNAT